jgi:hypothetical protein
MTPKLCYTCYLQSWLIPAIIESCRLKLMRTASSDGEETTLMPSATSPSVSSSSCELKSPKKSAERPGSSTTYNIFGPKAPSMMPNVYEANIDDFFDIGDSSTLFTITGSSRSDSMPSVPKSISTVSANERGTAIKHTDFMEGFGKQNIAYSPDSQSFTWPLEGARWDSGTYGQPESEQLNSAILREQEASPEWDLVMKNFDFLHSSSR